MSIEVKTKTTGFGSPAESYVDKRLDLNDLIVKDFYTTYYFKYEGDSKLGIETGDILVVDRGLDPKIGDTILINQNGAITISEFNLQTLDIWGTVTWTLSQRKK